MKAFLHHLQNKVRSIISPTYCVDGEFALNEIARATLQQYGIVQLSSATNSDSETEAATSKAVKTAYDKAVEAKTTADGKVGLNGNESINGEKSFENRIVAKKKYPYFRQPALCFTWRPFKYRGKQWRLLVRI